MDLEQAKRENRLEQFQAEHAAKRREQRKKTLDDEMDAYFASKNAPVDDDAAAKATAADDSKEKPAAEPETNGDAKKAEGEKKADADAGAEEPKAKKAASK